MARGHLEMADAVNDATTEREMDKAELMLAVWRECADRIGVGWSSLDADLHTMEKHGDDRPMCCGVLLDWEPKA